MAAIKQGNTNYNSFTVCGNLTQDLDIHPDRPNIATIHLATNDSRDHVSYFDIAYNGEERIRENKARLVKGAFVKITGQMRQERWAAEDGSKRSKVALSAVSVVFFDD